MVSMDGSLIKILMLGGRTIPYRAKCCKCGSMSCVGWTVDLDSLICSDTPKLYHYCKKCYDEMMRERHLQI